MRFLAVSGSLRAVSKNGALLDAARRLAPPGVELVVYDGLASLPHFNPDLDLPSGDGLPARVAELRALVGLVDAIIISSPEYAHGVPGSLKNALDWLVGGSEFPGKAVALLNDSPRATHAQAALAETVRTMSGRLVDEASIAVPLLASGLDAAGIVARPELAEPVRAALAAFVRAIEAGRSQ
jgi:NAD(P)H-dependent FMN reductase